MPESGEVILNPGDFCFAGEETRIRTLLGSCISITLWHRRWHIGGACHFMMPSRGGPPRGGELDGRYADEAMQMFMREINWRQTRPQEYEVRMFGGGNQFAGTPRAAGLAISGNNVEVGVRLLREHGFVLVDSHLGGFGYRRLTFDLSTGAVEVTHVRHHAERSAR